jgi:hypothetical protein
MILKIKSASTNIVVNLRIIHLIFSMCRLYINIQTNIIYIILLYIMNQNEYRNKNKHAEGGEGNPKKK